MDATPPPRGLCHLLSTRSVRADTGALHPRGRSVKLRRSATIGNVRRLPRHVVALAACAALAAAPSPAAPVAASPSAGGAMLSVVARDLNNPRKLQVGPGGELYVAEA